MRGEAVKERKRKEADARNEAYQKLTLAQKKERNSKKVIAKLEAQDK
jgi:hypothetical protein